MPDEMDLTTQEAIDLLSKWLDENRLIHLTLDGGLAMAKVLGRIDALTSDEVFFSAKKSKYELGRHNLAQFPLKKCRFKYSDAKDAPEPLRSQLAGYDALLYIYCLGSTGAIRTAVALAVLPVEEYTNF